MTWEFSFAIFVSKFEQGTFNAGPPKISSVADRMSINVPSAISKTVRPEIPDGI